MSLMNEIRSALRCCNATLPTAGRVNSIAMDVNTSGKQRRRKGQKCTVSLTTRQETTVVVCEATHRLAVPPCVQAARPS